MLTLPLSCNNQFKTVNTLDERDLVGQTNKSIWTKLQYFDVALIQMHKS